MPQNFLAQLTQSGALNVADPMKAYHNALAMKTAQLDAEGKLLEIGKGYLQRLRGRKEYGAYKDYMTRLGMSGEFLPEGFESDEEFEIWRTTAITSADALLKAKLGQKFKIHKVNKDGTTSEMEVTADQLQNLVNSGLVGDEWMMGSVEGTPWKPLERIREEKRVGEEEKMSETERLVGRINKLPLDSPDRKLFMARLKKLTESKQQTIRVNPDGSIEIIEGPAGEGKIMPAEQVGKMGEFKAYTDTLNEIDEMVRSGKADTGPFEFINKRLDNWGIMPKAERIELRNMVARLPGIMYAMRGKQLSDKELEVALNMMPRMEQDDTAFAISLRKFNDYLKLILKGREKAFKGAGYKVPSLSEPEKAKTIDERGDELEKQGLSEADVLRVLKMEGYY